MRFLLLLVLIAGTDLAMAKNLGHRAGSDYYRDLPENSLSVFMASCLGRDGEPALQNHLDFDYLEVDLKESKDGVIFLFHDSLIKRMIPENLQNQNVLRSLSEKISERKKRSYKYKKWKLEWLLASEIKQLKLKHTGEAPTKLTELFAAIKSCGFSKPIILEVKSLKSREAKERLLFQMQELKRNYLDKVDIRITEGFDFEKTFAVMGFRSAISDSFGSKNSEERAYWCGRLGELDLGGIYTPFFHSRNQCP